MKLVHADFKTICRDVVDVYKLSQKVYTSPVVPACSSTVRITSSDTTDDNLPMPFVILRVEKSKFGSVRRDVEMEVRDNFMILIARANIGLLMLEASVFDRLVNEAQTDSISIDLRLVD